MAPQPGVDRAEEEARTTANRMGLRIGAPRRIPTSTTTVAARNSITRKKEVGAAPWSRLRRCQFSRLAGCSLIRSWSDLRVAPGAVANPCAQFLQVLLRGSFIRALSFLPNTALGPRWCGHTTTKQQCRQWS